MKRWLHSNAVWPPSLLVAVFAVPYAMLEAGLWFIEHGPRNLGLQLEETPELRNIRNATIGGAAGLYALYRLWRFHPAWNIPYSAWLRCSPWSAGKPLPLGPVHPVWQDAAVLGILSAVACWRAQPAIPPIVFGLIYLIAMTLTLAFTRTWVPCLILGFLWPALILPAMKGPPEIGIFAAVLLATWFGHRESLRQFPWRRGDTTDARSSGAKSPLEFEIQIAGLSDSAVRTQNLGWPFGWLSPKVGREPIAASTSVAISALFGWWTYCAFVALAIPDCGPLLVLFGIFAAMLRLAIYCATLGPPFNIWGRFASGRIIVPGFDLVFITPLAVVALSIVCSLFARHSGAWMPEATACGMAALWWTLLSGGPTLQSWVLTGQHRYRPPARITANKQLLRRI